MKQSPSKLLRDRHGNGLMWALFIIIICMMMAALFYNVFALRSNYQAVLDEMTRCTSVSLDANLLNTSLRDTITDVETTSAIAALEQNLLGRGWTKSGSTWTKVEDGNTIYRLSGMSLSITGSRLHLTATAQIPLPMKMAGQIMVDFPVDMYARILYIDLGG